MLTVISWLIVGLLAGALARLLMPGEQSSSWIGAICLGIVGAVVGGFLWGLIGGKGVSQVLSDPWSLGSFLIAVVGAILFSFVWGALTRKR
ncbi:MAG: GlsB/YeaQ/YmgE family stress response membrane protein [Actinomycetaceae bacterium]|nr:GlsB/YeaQ/YmgE family stress response membrane protein [Actinomycetaceae bacterium]